MFKNISIKEKGLQQYLDDTVVQHDGFGYSVFVKLFNSGLGTADMARAFKVSRQTMFKWRTIYAEEQVLNSK